MDARKLGPLAWAAYGVAAILVVFPVVDSILGAWPLRLGDVQWRFGSLGLFSRALVTPALGVLLGVATAAAFGHRTRLRALAILAYLGSATCLAILGVFVLDAMQARTQVAAEAMTLFNTASGFAVVKYFTGAVLFALMGFGGFRAARPRGGAERGKGPGLVVGTSSEGRASESRSSPNEPVERTEPADGG